MRRIGNKLKSDSGVTVLFAILVFMLCILAGTGALTAAAANSGRYTHLKADQQQYLTVSSAVELLKGELSGKTFTAKARVTDVETNDGTTTTVKRTVEWVDTTNHITYDSRLKILLEDQLEKLFQYGVCNTLKDSTTITGTDFVTAGAKPAPWNDRPYTIDAGDMGKVTARLSMGTNANGLSANDFTVTIDLNRGEKYATTLTLLAAFADGAGENGLKRDRISETTKTTAAGGTVMTTVTEYTLEVKWLPGNTHVTATPEPKPTGG